MGVGRDGCQRGVCGFGEIGVSGEVGGIAGDGDLGRASLRDVCAGYEMGVAPLCGDGSASGHVGVCRRCKRGCLGWATRVFGMG